MNVTIITASFNSALSIKTCLDSVVHQNYNDIEYLIIDGKSSDATLKIIKVYQQKCTPKYQHLKTGHEVLGHISWRLEFLVQASKST